MNKRETMYAELCGAKSDPQDRLRFYQIYPPNGAPHKTGWVGPFRDKTDAENAAADVAKVGGFELEWVN